MESNSFHFEEVIPGTAAYELYLEFRYAVFCEELGRIASADCSVSTKGKPIETDRYDPHSRHFFATYKATGEIAAVARVILPSPVGLNVTPRYIIERPLPYPDVTEENTGEISRMAVSPRFRRRHYDTHTPLQGHPEENDQYPSDKERRYLPELVLGMYQEIYILAKESGISYCLAAMDNRYSRLIRLMGFPCEPVGPINNKVTPPRRVYLIRRESIPHGAFSGLPPA